jgi:hypothetical protein
MGTRRSIKTASSARRSATSGPDVAYRVTYWAGEYRCWCPAGDGGRRCWHAALYAVRANRFAWGEPADGPSAEQAAATEGLARWSRAGRKLAGTAEAVAA